ncbi:MAG: MazG nucleotide pyrophosphohydrolase domain-containing protein [Ktedonobacteraceae bacterium]
MRTLQDFQAFHQWLDEQKRFDPDILFNMVLLIGEVGEVAEVLKNIRKKADSFLGEYQPEEALASALADYREELAYELADCLAYILKLANYTEIDLQEAYLKKMARNVDRAWWTTKDKDKH